MTAKAKGFRETAEKEMEATSKNSMCLGLWPGEKRKEAILKLEKKINLVNVMKRTWRKAIAPLQQVFRMQGLDALYKNLTPWNSMKTPSTMSAKEETYFGSREKACSSLWGEMKRVYFQET